MKNPSVSSFKRAIGRINAPRDFDAILQQAGLQRRTKYQTQRALGWAGFFTLGLVAGSAVGIFLAPKRGKEMREQVRDQVREKLPIGKGHSILHQERSYDELN